MITVIARFKMLPDKEAEALAALKEMVAAVEANEPGVVAYGCNRGKSDPLQVCFYEVYRDQEAFDAHSKTPHMAAMRAAFAQTMDRASFSVEMLEQLAGFVRP